MIRAMIVDDEAPGRTNLRLALAAFPRWTLVAECSSAQQARDTLALTEVDVVFLDVQMPHESGIGLARSLAATSEPPLLVFVTAFSRYAVDAFDVHALDYLLKPLDDERLAQTLERAEAMLLRGPLAGYRSALNDYVEEVTRSELGQQLPYLQRVSIRSVGRIEAVELSEVLWLASAGNYVELHLGQRSVLHRVALSRLEPRLDPAQFIRVHRTAMVRRTQLRELQVIGDGVYLARLACGAKVPVSARYVGAVRSCIEAPAD